MKEKLTAVKNKIINKLQAIKTCIYNLIFSKIKGQIKDYMSTKVSTQIDLQGDKIKIDKTFIQGKHFAITGKLKNHTRIEAITIINNNQCFYDDMLTKNTTFLVISNIANRTAMQRQAMKMIQDGQEIHIINEQEFDFLMNNSK